MMNRVVLAASAISCCGSGLPTLVTRPNSRGRGFESPQPLRKACKPSSHSSPTHHVSIVTRCLRRFGCRVVRDESGAAAAGGEAEEPADEDDQAVLEADEVEEVHHQPGRPGGEAAQPDARGGRRPRGRGRSSRGCPCPGSGTARSGGRLGAHERAWPRSDPAASRPVRRRRSDWTPPSRLRTRTMSPSARTSGWPGSVRSGSTVNLPARSGRRRSARRAGTPGSTPRRPRPRSRRARRCARWSRRAPRRVTASSSIPTTVRSSRSVTPRRLERARGLCATARAGRRSARGPRSRSTGLASDAESMERNSPSSVPRASSAIWPAISTPVGTGADDHEGRARVAAVWIGSVSAASNAPRMRATCRERALERLDLGRVAAPFVVAEVGVVRAAGDDQRVVGQRARYGQDRTRAHRRGRSPRPRPSARARCPGA